MDSSTIYADPARTILPSRKEDTQLPRDTFLPEAHPLLPQNFQRLPEEIVGMDALVQDVVGKLDNVKKLGFAGMGGVGKTTLAQAVFNHLGPTFEFTCFVSSMKVIPIDAKAAVCEHMYCHGKKIDQETFWSPTWRRESGEENWYSLKNKTMLVVLDDIHLRDVLVLHELARDSAPESRFIVTSRDREVLSSLDDVFVVPFLESKAAKVLFLSCAFPMQTEPHKGLETIMNEIIKKCDGLPLTLKVLGKYLKRKMKVEHWEETLIALTNAEAISSLDERLWAKLRPSYNDLTKKEQEIFLDASTFFCSDTATCYNPEWTLREAKAAWSAAYDASAGILWQTLVDRSLVDSVEEDEAIKVHEQLQSLGQRIASEPSNIARCRVGDGEVGSKMLQSTAGDLDGKGFHALRLDPLRDVWMGIPIPEAAHPTLKELQFLDINYLDTSDSSKDCGYIPTEVVLLKSAGPCHLNPTVHTRLVVLSLNCPSNNPLPSSIGHLECLEHLTIPCWSRLLPDSLGQLRSLQRLTLLDAPLLESLPESFGQLRALQHLTMNSTLHLKSLPESFGQLRTLQHLTMYLAPNLKSLPESFGQLQALQYLRINHAYQLKSLPESFGQLGALQYLSINHVVQLKNLPESFGQLRALQHLTIDHASKFESLPASFGQLGALQHFSISHASGLKSLPESFGQLGALQHFSISHAWGLKSLPESVGQLGALQHLTIQGAQLLKNLPESFGQLRSLQQLIIDGREGKSLPESFGQLGALQRLTIEGATVETFPESFGQLRALQHLTITDAYELISLPESFGQLGALQHLTIKGIRRVKSLPQSFGQLRALQHLTIKDAYHLNSLSESFGQLGALQKLFIGGARELESLPESFGQLRVLTHLTIRDAYRLNSMPESFGQLSALRYLTIREAYELESLPESFGKLSSLNHLIVEGDGLCRLPEAFGQLQALQHLHLDCRKLKWLPGSFGGLKALKSLEMRSRKLHLPNRLDQLAEICRLEIDADIERWPDSVQNLTSLHELKIGYYSALCIPDCMQMLPSLQRLALEFRMDLAGPLSPWLSTPNAPNNIFKGSLLVFQVEDGCFSLIEGLSTFKDQDGDYLYLEEGSSLFWEGNYDLV